MLCSCFFFTSSVAQTIDTTAAEDSTHYYYTYIPKYEWSIGIEHSYIPGMFAQGASVPDNFEISGWIKQRFYWQAGAFYIRSITKIIAEDSIQPFSSDTTDTISKGVYFQSGYAFYAGFTLKLFLFKNAYATPSFNLFFDHYTHDPNESWLISIGPSAAFEYFISNRFSLRADLFNFNIGIGNSGKFLVTTHRVMGLGLRYSFDLKKQE